MDNQDLPQKPYDFQKMVSQAYLAGEDILLCAPTGSGKTQASVTPALKGFLEDGLHDRHESPPRMIFVAPLKTLVRSQYQTIEEAYRSKKSSKKLWEREWKPSIQTGDDPGDPFFERKIILATVDQLLASFLNIPYGIPRKLDNINVGAMLGSYLIFDELHLYPYNQMMLTVLAMLKLLKGVSRFTLMTATLSQPLVDAIAKELGMRVIGNHNNPQLFDDVSSLNQQRTWHAHDETLTAEKVREYHHKKTLCICNTVERAQNLYEAVTTLMPDVEIMLLHSRFTKTHRKAKENRLLGLDGGDSFEQSNKPMIVIATQVVEVGLDMSADVLLTECAPASSLIQRAGRCARRGGTGDVRVFRPPYVVDKETGEPTSEIDFMPYSDGDQLMETISNQTWQALLSDEFNGRVLKYADEQQLVNQAHGEADKIFADNLSTQIDNRIRDILKCMALRDDSAVHTLIREQNTVPLYIHHAPNADEILTTRPFLAPSFSLSKGQIAHFYEDAIQAGADFILMGCTAETIDKSSDDMQTETRYVWHKVKDKNEIYKTYRWFVAHPDVIGYTNEIGLRFSAIGVMGLDDTASDQKSHTKHFDGYIADRYHEHIAGLYHAYTIGDGRDEHIKPPLRDEFLYPLRRLCEALGKNAEMGERLMRLTIALHDVGKLNRPWQAWVVAWQHYVAKSQYAHIITVPPDGNIFAHSDNRNLPPDFKLAFKHKSRGNHAVESAEACHKILLYASEGDKLWRNVAMRAIMHHHTPSADKCDEFQLIEDGKNAIAHALHECGFGDDEIDQFLPLIQPQFKLHGRAVSQAQADLSPSDVQDPKEVMLYYLFVRILRLADQRSLDIWQYYLKKERS